MPVPVAARTNAWFCGLSLSGIMGSNPTGKRDVFSVVSEIETPVLLAHAIEDSTDIFGISEGGFTPQTPSRYATD